MRLFVANPTKQHLVFHYRKPESKNVLAVHIAAGSQEQIEDDRLTQAEIDEIVRQNEIYGLVPLSSVGKSTRGGANVPHMVFSIGQPITLTKIYEALEAQDDRMRRLGDETRINTAAGLQSALEQSTGAEVRVLETEVIQIDENGKPMEGPGAINNGVTVSKDTPQEPARRNRRRAQ